jgi:hypothetical protein
VWFIRPTLPDRLATIFQKSFLGELCCDQTCHTQELPLKDVMHNVRAVPDDFPGSWSQIQPRRFVS